MSETTPTMRVLRKGDKPEVGPVTINVADFDPANHTIVEGEPAPAPAAAAPVAPVAPPVAEVTPPVAPVAPDANQPPATAPVDPNALVAGPAPAEIDGLWFMVDPATGKPTHTEGFKTRAALEKVIAENAEPAKA